MIPAASKFWMTKRILGNPEKINPITEYNPNTLINKLKKSLLVIDLLIFVGVIIFFQMYK
jgi:hypothetical protein